MFGWNRFLFVEKSRIVSSFYYRRNAIIFPPPVDFHILVQLEVVQLFSSRCTDGSLKLYIDGVTRFSIFCFFKGTVSRDLGVVFLDRKNLINIPAEGFHFILSTVSCLIFPVS